MFKEALQVDDDEGEDDDSDDDMKPLLSQISLLLQLDPTNVITLGRFAYFKHRFTVLHADYYAVIIVAINHATAVVIIIVIIIIITIIIIIICSLTPLVLPFSVQGKADDAQQLCVYLTPILSLIMRIKRPLYYSYIRAIAADTNHEGSGKRLGNIH